MSPLYTLTNSVFRNFLYYAVISLIKMMILSLITSRQRMKTKVFAKSEDSSHGNQKKIVPNTFDPDVERVRDNYFNDIHNIVAFVLIGFCYIACNPVPNTALWYFRIFFFSGLLHTFAYQIPLPQPIRNISFIIGLFATLSMAIRVLLRIS